MTDLPLPSSAAAEELANQARRSILHSHGDPNTPTGRNAQAALVAAADLLGRSPTASCGQSRRESRDASAKAERTILLSAAEGRILLPGDNVADEGEHRVNKDRALAHKATNQHRYGVILDQDEWAEDRRLKVRNALPSEYIWRLGLQNVVFEDDIHLTGISDEPLSRDPSIHTSQPWIAPACPMLEVSMPDIKAFMEAKGFTQLPRGMTASGVPRILAWYRPADEVLVYDAKPGNFVKATDDFLYPIDLNVSIFPRALMRETAALNSVNWPELGGEA